MVAQGATEKSACARVDQAFRSLPRPGSDARSQPAPRPPDDVCRGIAPADKSAERVEEQTRVDPGGDRAKHLALEEVEAGGRAQVGR
jgi:hypothetical protein